MCGIAGLFLPIGATMVEADMEAMLAAMIHRGPDGKGRHVSNDHRFQAGFTRLAIIDLETGDQPIVEKNGARVLLGNGEIYNYRELRAENPNYPYQTQGDMETILPLVSAYGPDFVHHLNGMYGLALYERDPHRLLLVRDRLGVKPLYWARTAGGGVLFASEIKSLFASGLVTPAVNEDAVSAYLAHGYVPGPATLFEGVNKLPPGHTLTVDAEGSVTIERYWQARMADDVPVRAEAIEEHLIGLLRDSVRLQLRSDVPLGALLSGGIDSGLVVALAAELSSHPLKTFTVRFEGANVDESPLAQAVADHYGTEHLTLDLPATSVTGHLPKLAWFAEEPNYDAAVLPNFLIEEILGHHVKVALNGTGGDELFAGYGRYFPLPVETRWLKVPGFLRKAVEGLIGLASPFTAWQLARAGKFEADRGGYLHDHACQFPPPMRRLAGNGQVIPAPAQQAYFAEFEGPTQTAALYADLNTYLPEDLLMLLDRTSMAVSVEGRVPFLDHRLVEAAFAVPPGIRTPNGRQKGLERSMAKRFLPETLLNAPKQGFASPVPAWMEAGLGDLSYRILTRKETLDRGWWTANGIRSLTAHPHRHGFRVYTLLMLELAVRIHVERADHSHVPTEGLEAFADG